MKLSPSPYLQVIRCRAHRDRKTDQANKDRKTAQADRGRKTDQANKVKSLPPQSNSSRR